VLSKKAGKGRQRAPAPAPALHPKIPVR